MGRSIETRYVYRCDSPPACGEALVVDKGQEWPIDGLHLSPVSTADDADQVAQARGWYFRGGKAICPHHVMAGGR